jgi:hypothetical protein
MLPFNPAAHILGSFSFVAWNTITSGGGAVNLGGKRKGAETCSRWSDSD